MTHDGSELAIDGVVPGRPMTHSVSNETKNEPNKAVPQKRKGTLRALGLGLITGAADDDPSAIGTYASAGAAFGPAFLWMAPVTFPMMFAVVYLSAKLGQVSGQGLFAVLRKHYPRWLLYPTLIAVLIGNTIEAGADLGGIGAALNLFFPVSNEILVVMVAGIVLALQVFAPYTMMRNIFRVLALALLAYVPAAILGRPDGWAVLKGTVLPKYSGLADHGGHFCGYDRPRCQLDPLSWM